MNMNSHKIFNHVDWVTIDKEHDHKVKCNLDQCLFKIQNKEYMITFTEIYTDIAKEKNETLNAHKCSISKCTL